MNDKDTIKQTEEYVQKTLKAHESGHDWWHIERVRNIALKIAKEEKADLFVVELSALLHDIADHKFHGGDSTVGPKVAREFLSGLALSVEVVDQIVEIIDNMSFNKTLDGKSGVKSKELQVVQDADRLDAMGAIGIARAFSYGGHKGRPFYEPNTKPIKYKNSEEYKKNPAGTTINHFYEKLLLLKDMMNTKYGKKLAKKRHAFLENFLDEFLAEWKALR
ncbi:MAG: HD domain-containing protein [Patescibacteria group bacterium]